jgi:hypothetical protein
MKTFITAAAFTVGVFYTFPLTTSYVVSAFNHIINYF